jgi:hypothetical protein
MIRMQARPWPLQPELRLALAGLLLVALIARPNNVTLSPQPAVVGQKVATRSHDYFGGRPVREGGTPIQLGPAAAAGIWARFSPFATAPPSQAPSCLAAAPPVARGVAAATQIADDVPGLYGAPWVASVHGYLVAALHVTVPRNPARQPVEPVLQIYRQGAVQPAFSQAVPVSVVRGSSALLYRMLVNGPITCIDLVIPYGAGAGTAHVYYPFRGRMFEAEGSFSVQR